MNKKGFTLVELLAVIVILALLALLTSTAVTKLVGDAKKDLSNTQTQLIKSAAEVWVADNLDKLPSAGECSYLTLEDLKNYGLLDSTILNPINNQKISNDLKIKISTTSSKYGNPVTTVEVNPENIDDCEAFPLPSCYAIEGDGTKVGDKISCTLSESTDNFYVISNDGINIEMLTEYNINKTTYRQINSSDAVAFSTTNYWVDENGDLLSQYGTTYPADVYEGNDKIKPIVDEYVNYLSKDLTNATGSLLTFSQAKSLGCNDSTNSCSSAPSWLYTRTYWLGSVDSASSVWYISVSNINTYENYRFDQYGFNVRPVITIPVIELQ